MAGEVIETAFVEVQARIAAGFAADVKRQVDRALARVRGEVEVVARDNFRTVQASAQKALSGIRASAKKPINVQMQVRNPEGVATIQAQLTELRAQAAEAITQDINADTTEVTTKIRALQAKLKILEADKVEIEVDVDTTAARAELFLLDKSVKDSGNGFNGFSDTISKALSGLSAPMAGLPLKFAALLPAIAPLTGILVGAAAAATALAGAVGLAAGSLITLGGVASSVGLAFAAVKIASSGVGDAMKAQSAAQEELARTGEISAATQDKLDAAMKNLTPAARQVVRALASIKTEFSKTQKTLQQSLFEGQAKNLKAVTSSLLPAFSKSLLGITDALNKAGDQFTEFVTKGKGAKQISGILDGLSDTFVRLIPAFGNVGAALLNLFGPAAKQSGSLADSIVTLTQRFQDFTARITADGSFQDFLKRAEDAAGALFSVFGNLGRVIVGVLGAGADTGVGMLKSISDSLGNLSDKIKSVAGQEALGNFFDTIGTAGRTISTIFQELGPTISTAFAVLAPILQGITSVVGGLAAGFNDFLQPVLEKMVGPAENFAASMDRLRPVFENIGRVLGPVIGILGALFTALFVLGPVIGPLISVIGTLGTIIGAIGLGPVAAIAAVAALVTGMVILYNKSQAVRDVVDTLGNAFKNAFAKFDLSAVIASFKSLDLSTLGAGLSESLGSIGGVLKDLAPIVQKLFGGYFATASDILQNAVVPALQQVGDFIGGTLLPHLSDLADVFKAQVLPAVDQLVTAFVDNIQPALADFFETVSKDVLPVVLRLSKDLLKVLKPIQKVGLYITGFLIKVIAKLLPVIGFLLKAIGKIIVVIFKFIGVLLTIIETTVKVAIEIGKFVGKIIGFFVNLPGRIQGYIDAIIQFFVDLPGNLFSALGSLGSIIGNAFSTAFTAVTNFVKTGITQIIGFFSGLPGKIGAAVGNLATSLVQKFKQLFIAVGNAERTGITKVVQFFKDLPGKILNALKDLVGKLKDLFVKVATAVIEKVKTFVTNVINFYRALPGKIVNVLSSIREKIVGIFQRAMDSAKEKVRNGVDNIVQGFRDLVTKIKGVGTSIFNAAKTVGSKIIDGLVAGVKGAGGFAGDIAGAIYNAIDAAIPSIHINFPSPIPDFNYSAFPFAKGGVVRKAMLALVGEAGPEAILPLTNASRSARLLAESGLADMPAIQQVILDRLALKIPQTTARSSAAFGRTPGRATQSVLSKGALRTLSAVAAPGRASTASPAAAAAAGPTRTSTKNTYQTNTFHVVSMDPEAQATIIAARVAAWSER